MRPLKMKLEPRKLPPHPDARETPVTFKCSRAEKAEIRKLAATFTEGANVSEWIRRAALNYLPGKMQFEKGDVLSCETCGAHILTFAVNTTCGDRIRAELFTLDGGQAPWKNGEKTECRKCGTPFFRTGGKGLV